MAAVYHTIAHHDVDNAAPDARVVAQSNVEHYLYPDG